MGILKAVKPEVIEPGKPKFMLSGKSGVGKTLFSLDFPKPYLIDTEGGATRPQYREKLTRVGGVYFGKEQGSQDFSTVIEEIKQLATTKHEYKTLIIDSFSHLYNTAAAIAEEKFGNDFGKDKKEANRPTRQLMRWLETIDMTVILICHQREKWERRGRDVINTGTTFDGYDKLEYVLDLWMEVQKIGQERIVVVKKSRIEGFPEAKEMPMDYKGFAELYGSSVIERVGAPVVLISSAQVEHIKGLVNALNISKETVETWFEKSKVEKWEELTEGQAKKFIDYCDKRLVGITQNGNGTTTVGSAVGRK
jgi:hypothetical protein